MRRAFERVLLNVKISLQGSLSYVLLNNIRYNLDRTNLEQHGIHPRWLHALVNLPMLFGPFVVVACHRISLFIRNRYFEKPIIWKAACASSIITSLALLSTSPHQEPRFLVPMLAPIVLILSGWIVKLKPSHSKWFWAIWILYNTALGLVFGVTHQGGVIPSLIHLKKHTHDERHATRVVYWKLFTPPRHLLRLTDKQQIDFHHLAGSPVQRVIDLIKDVTEPPRTYRRSLAVLPNYAAAELRSALALHNMSLVQLWSWGPHVNFDHIGDVDWRDWNNQFKVTLWQVVDKIEEVHMDEVINRNQGQESSYHSISVRPVHI